MKPRGWKLTTLGTACNGCLQTGPFGSQLHAEEYTETGICVLMPKDLNNGEAITECAAKIPSAKAEKLKKHKLQQGDILFSRRGDVARTAFITSETEGALCGTGCLRARPSSDAEGNFLKYFLQRNQSKKWLEQNAVGQTMLNLNTTILTELPLLLPPLPEQKKIAKILATWDEAIATTEQLIEASKKQKKALMQKLLTGKERFKEFEGEEWKTVTIKDLGRCITGLTYSPDDVCENGLLVLRSSNIQQGQLTLLDKVCVSTNVVQENKTQDGDILICVRNGSKHLIGKSALITQDGVGVTHGAFMTLFRGPNSNYIFQLLQSDSYHRQVKRNLGATINSINTSDLYKFTFLYPVNEQEVKKISSLFNCCDQELANYQTKLAKLKKEKKALMQQLLTGKRRVTVDEEAEKTAVAC